MTVKACGLLIFKGFATQDGALVEEEFNVTLTTTVFVYRMYLDFCFCGKIDIDKSKIRERSGHGGATYLAKKLRSPVPTPRKLKKMRTMPPRKVSKTRILAWTG